MNKIYSEPIDKANTLIEGLTRNQAYLKTKGYDLSVVELLQKYSAELAVEGEKIAAEERAIAEHRVQCHILLSRLKEHLQHGKDGIKQMFDQELWEQYGVTDKR